MRLLILLMSLALGAAPPIAQAGPSAAPGCLASGNGYLRARIRGAVNLDIDWKNAELECDGGARPNGHGIRLSFAGPQRAHGRRLRMVFGIAAVRESTAGHELATNVTVIFEGEARLFTTRGEDRCTVDELQQERVGSLGSGARSYRVVARGFCTLPATDLAQDERIVITRFDFAGRVSFDHTATDSATNQEP